MENTTDTISGEPKNHAEESPDIQKKIREHIQKLQQLNPRKRFTKGDAFTPSTKIVKAKRKAQKLARRINRKNR